ncbi:MAG: class I SAM-dependent methyltransferase [Planctomycetota bacterium]|jgi:phospholipid N-methyltransferase
MLTFLVQGLRRQREVGTIVPSSPWLARAMTEPVRRDSGTKRVLEVGPGTGAFTAELLSLLKPGDSFELAECNQTFCRRIESRLLEPFRRVNPDVAVTLHPERIETADVAGTFDYIVCSVPFKVLEPSEVRAIFRRLLALLSDDGQLTYYEYAGVRVFKAPLISPAARRHLYGVDAVSRTIHRRHRATRRLVLLNILPAFAVQLGHADRRPTRTVAQA